MTNYRTIEAFELVADWHEKQAKTFREMSEDIRIGKLMQLKAGEVAKHHAGSAAALRLRALNDRRKALAEPPEPDCDHRTLELMIAGPWQDIPPASTWTLEQLQAHRFDNLINEGERCVIQMAAKHILDRFDLIPKKVV